MTSMLSLAFACHLVAILVSISFGLTYLLRSQFMPYHAVALGKEWREVPSEVQILVLALMRAVGGGTLATALVTSFVLFIPFRAGEIWALWAVASGGLVLSAGSLYAMRIVAANTPASPPFKLVLLGLALFVIGFALSLAAGAQ
jgi:hypothetical protein